MTSRRELFEHDEKLWVLCVGKNDGTRRFAPLVDLIDWYNNQLLTKAVLENHVSLEAGQTALLSTIGLLPTERLLIFGLGDLKDTGIAVVRKLCQDLGRALGELKAPTPWIVVAADAPDKFSDKFVDEIKKSRTSMPALARATISVG